MTETQVTEGEGLARWTRLATLGLVLAALGPLIMLVASLVWGLEVGDELPFFVITSAIGLLGAFLVYRFGTWAKVVGVVAALLMSLALFWTAFGLGVPSSFFDFVPAVLVIPGALIAIVSCVSAIVAKRRGHTSATAVGGEQRALRIVLTVVIVLAALSGVLTFVSRSSVAEADADTIVAFSDFEFDQSSYELAAGSRVLVRNDDPFMHTFTVEELDIDVTLTPGSEKLVEIPGEPGTYVAFCRPHTSDPEDPTEDDMWATLVVQ